jgi:3-oxoacyl-[acyl-carrier protein] reductase
MADEKVLSGNVAVVTGAARGIGREIAISLAKAGAEVIVCDVIKDEADDATHKIITQAGQKAEFIELDVSDFERVSDAFKKIESDCGGLHILINNAGVTDDQLMGRMKPANWNKVIDVNLNGCFNTCRAASRIMLKQKSGRIINVSSIVARIGRPGQTNYGASKAGIEGITRSLALELGHRGITVNAVAPGYIDTDMTKSLSDEVKEEIYKRIPIGRPGSPADVADLVLFLAGPGASYITGQTIQINGGLYFG